MQEAALEQTAPSADTMAERAAKLAGLEDRKFAEVVSPEVLRDQGKRLFKELGKITNQDRSIHRRMTKVWTSLTGRKTPDTDQTLLWTQTKDARYLTMTISTPEDSKDSVSPEEDKDGDMVIEGYGDQSKNQVESYIVQMNTVKGKRNGHHKIRIAPSGISLLTRIEDTENFEPDQNFPPRILKGLQETIQQLKEKSG